MGGRTGNSVAGSRSLWILWKVTSVFWDSLRLRLTEFPVKLAVGWFFMTTAYVLPALSMIAYQIAQTIVTIKDLNTAHGNALDSPGRATGLCGAESNCLSLRITI
ncbi:hypothetical protein C8R44DRAFT_753094 [Mycena epipterygia]|nr:hypothetical protein C8R44DRAFT_753094 [Mycena epipterygia]